MKNNIINFLTNINIYLVSIIIVSFILSFLFLHKKKISLYLKELYIILFVSIAWIIFYFCNDILNSIFKLSYFNIKLYLLILIIVNIITIININFIKSIIYKIINYILFSINVIIFIINASIFIGNRINTIEITFDNITKLININYIAFIIYLNLISYIYLGKIIINSIKIKRKKELLISEENNNNEITKEENYHQTTKEEPVSNNTIENGFIIDGIDCSIIFEDSDKKEILENYYILLNNVNAKLVNGYTIHEYKKIKDIINRLDIKDINKINLDINKLSMITYDEYNLLKSYLESKNIKI